MKHFLFCMLLITLAAKLAAQRIHSHNDYQQGRPLTNALKQKVFSIEADVFITSRGLVVAHDKKDTATAPLLQALYLQPIITLFTKHLGRISRSKNYAPVLMIDIKDNSEAVIPALVVLTASHTTVFDRNSNPLAVQLVLSGDRGAINKWPSYPSYIFFDGRPDEVYSGTALSRVAFISDVYKNYVSGDDSTHRIEALMNKVHGMQKLLRLWGHPDTAAEWKRLFELGVDIVNTDRVKECRDYFSTR